MGILSLFDFASRVAALPPIPSGLASPWSTTELTKIALSDIFGTDVSLPVTRAQAMKVPAVAKGRALIVGTLSRQPLAKFKGAEKVAADPWMYRSSRGQSPQMRTMWTLDDLIFYGTSLWLVERGSRGNIIDAMRAPREWWYVDPDSGEIVLNGNRATKDEVIYFEGPQDGLLSIARDDIEAALAMSSAWGKRGDSPVPLIELHITDINAQLTDAEQDALVDQWESARRLGGTALTPAEIETKVHGTTPTDLFIEGRNASRLDFANFLALPGAMLDGSTATASLTYSTKEGSRNELVDLSLAYWATPFEARLSMDDVTPAGTRIAFDLEYLSAPNQPAQGPAHLD